MTDYAKLIAEAEKRADQLEKHAWMAKRDVDQEEMREDAKQLRQLAAAVRELAPQEGWRVTVWTKIDGGMLIAKGSRQSVIDNKLAWDAYTSSNQHVGEFPTASAAMSALDEDKR